MNFDQTRGNLRNPSFSTFLTTVLKKLYLLIVDLIKDGPTIRLFFSFRTEIFLRNSRIRTQIVGVEGKDTDH